MAINFDATYRYQGREEANELVLREATQLPALSENFGIVEGVKGRQAVHTLERIRKVTYKDPGCNTTAYPMNLTTTLKTWDPQDLEIFRYECWKTLRGKIVEWKLKTLNDKSDLTNTDIEDYYIDILKYAAFEDLHRLAWFGDMSITAASLTLGADDVKNYDGFNGIWKQVFAAEAAGHFVHVNIDDNDEDTSEEQELEDGDAFPIFQKMFNKAPQELKNLPSSQKQFLVTDSLLTAYLNYRESQNLDNSFDIQESGVTTLRYRGVALRVVNLWDEIIAADFLKNGKRDLPHRAILTQQGNLQLAFDAQPMATQDDNPLITWYDIKTKEWYARLNYVADSKLANDKRIIAAY